MNYKFPVNVTIELIESKVSQETLMYTYYGQPVKKGLFRSRVRNDDKPTVAYYRNHKGRLIIKDFGSDYCGDWVYVVMQKYNCGYYKALNIVASDLGLIPQQDQPSIEIKYSTTKLDDRSDAIIRVEIKEFSQNELEWWGTYGITKELLDKFHVYSCKNIFLNGNLFHLYKKNQLVFGYFGGIRGGIERWKIYFAGNKRYKFIGNWKSIYIQGYHTIPTTGEWICLTKSMKDCILLYSLGIPAIAPNSETCYLTDAQHSKIIKRFTKVAILWDNDYAGIYNLNKIRKSHPELYPCWINRSLDAKDISDFYKKYGRDRTLKLIGDAKEKINREWTRRKEEEKSQTEQS